MVSSSSVIYTAKIVISDRVVNDKVNKSESISLYGLAFSITPKNNLRMNLIKSIKLGFSEENAIEIYNSGKLVGGAWGDSTETRIGIYGIQTNITAPATWGSAQLRIYVYNSAGTKLTSSVVQKFEVLPECHSITVANFPSKLYVNESIDYSEFEVIGNFDNGQSVITSYQTSKASGSSFSSSDIGKQTITISYTDTYGTQTQNIEVEVVGLDHIEFENVPTDIKVGTIFAFPSNFKVRAYYTDGSSEDATSVATTNLDNYIGVSMDNVETKTLKASFTDTIHSTNMTASVSTSFEIYGLSELVLSKTSATFKVGEKFSFDGEITAKFSDGTSETIDKTDCLWNGKAWATFVLNAFTESDVTSLLDVVVSYQDITVKQEAHISVSIVGLSSIAFSDTKHYIVGATYPSTVTATATYSDGSTKSVTAEVTSEVAFSSVGVKDMTISYTEGGITRTKTFQITVDDKSIASIDSVATHLTKSTFKVGEIFSKAGLTFNVTYNDGTTDVVAPDSVATYEGMTFANTNVGQHELSVTIGGITKNLTGEVITVIKLSSIAITGSLGGTGSGNNEYAHGDYFNSSLIRLTKTYSNGSTESDALPTSVSPVNGARLTVGGANTVTVTLTEGDVTVTTTSTIYVKTISTLYFDGTQPTSFLYGASFSLGTAKVMASYVGDFFEDEEVTDFDINIAIGSTLNYKSSREIRITKGGAALTYTIHIVYLSAISTVSGAKTSFFSGDYFEFGDDAMVTVTYAKTDGTTETEDVYLADERISSSYNEAIKLTSLGNQNVPIRFTDTNGQSIDTSYSIEVLEDEVESIDLDTSAFDDLEEEDEVGLTKFYAGYTMFYKTPLVVVTATYSSGRTSVIPVNDYVADIQNGKTFNEVGTATITITYKDKTATYDVEVVAHSVTDIEIDTATNQVPGSFAIGDAFAATGLIVRAIYASGYKKTIEVGANGYSISPAIGQIFEDADYGSQAVTITYQGHSKTYGVNVGYPVVDHAIVNTSSVNMQPKNHDVFLVDNITVTLVYTNGLVKTLEKASSSVATAGKFYVDTTNLNLDGDGKIDTSTGAKEITVTCWNPYTLVGTESTQVVKLSVAVLPDGALSSIYIDAGTAKTTYKTGEQFTGEGFVIMAKLVDYDEYVRVDVAGNDNVVTNPVKGSIFYNAGQVDVKFQYTLHNVVKEATFTINVIPSYQKTSPQIDTLKIVKMKTFDTTVISLEKSGLSSKEASQLSPNRDGYLWLLFSKNDTEIDNDSESETYGRRIIKGSYTNVKCYGYVISGSRTADSDITVDNGKVILFEDYTPTIEGQSNITVKFRRTVKGNADKINLCRDILLYGYKTNRNRAFVSQNSKVGLENIDYHSEAINLATMENYEGLSDGDLTYFPDTGYTGIGQNSNKIVGEAILNNGYMIIIKSDSRQEPTVYFRHCEMAGVVKADGSTAKDATGNQLFEETYPVEPGNIGDGGISTFSLISFYGDTLFLTKKGIKGIDVGTSTSLTDDSKYATDRSTLINKRLLKEDLSKAHLFKFNDFLILSVNKHCYVANYNYRTGSQYEWWYLDNIDANAFFEVDEELYFANTKGELCKFKYEDTHKDYTDKPRTFIGQGGVLPIAMDDLNNANKLVFNFAKYKDTFENGDYLSVLANESKNSIYGLIGKFVAKDTVINQGLDFQDFQGLIDREHGYFKIDAGDEIESNGYTKSQNLKELLSNNRVVYLDQIQYVGSPSTNAVGVPYTLVTVDDYGEDLPPYCFRLRRQDGSYADLNNLEMVRVSFQIGDNSIITNKEVDEENQVLSCQLIGDHNLLIDLIQYNNQATESFAAVVTKKQNVEAYWVTRPFDMNQPMNLKHIFYWLVKNDSELASHTDLGSLVNSSVALKSILDKGESIVLKSQVSDNELDLGATSIESWTTDVNGLPKSHMSDKTVEDIESIAFVFKNYDDTNMVLSNLSVEYTVGNTI